MKKTIFLVFLVLTFIGYSQKKSFDLSLSSGISSPSSSFSDASYASSGTFIDLSGAYYFSKFGIGLSIGQISNPTDSNLNFFSNTFDFTAINTAEDWKIIYYGLGSEFKTSFNKIEAILSLRTGIMNIQPVFFESRYNENVDVSIPVYSLETDKTSITSYFSSGIKIGYNLSSNLTVFATANYISALSNDLTIVERTIADANNNGIIDTEDFLKFDPDIGITYNETSTTIKPQSTNFGFGLNYNFRSKENKVDKNTRNQQNRKENQIENRSSTITSKERVTIVLTNPAKEKVDKKKKQQKLVNALPRNNSQFKNQNDIKTFSWEVVGERIMKPSFVLEVQKIDRTNQPQRTYVAQTLKSSIKGNAVFKDNKLSDGNYRWTVTETTTGITSNPSYFSMSQCDIELTITNEEIECLGYEQENRKFKICFDVTYASASGDLTFVNPGSGLSVYDQTYAALSYTLVSPNLTLVTQIGASTSIVSYCFEVSVPASVTSIGFGLQGDDLDPSPIVCQPGVSLFFDELPTCLCDECEEIELSFDDFNITPNGATGNQFNFNGNINVNIPIYGMEFQIQSYSYTANPSACVEGVGSVEESGMFLMPGTTINGATALQLFNETASGSATSNDNATKDIKYTSITPLTGSIPTNLTIGLPGPISGLDPSCCVISYTVCIKVKIFYEEGNCKSCVFTHCFEFNNQ